MTWAQRRMTVHTFEPVSRAEVAHLLRRDSAIGAGGIAGLIDSLE